MNSIFLFSVKSVEVLTLVVFTGVLVILFVLEARARFRKSRNVVQKIESNAIVLSLEETGIYINHQPQIKIQMQVIPSKGRNFVAELEEFVPVVELATIRAGATVRVKYNPENHKEIRLVPNRYLSI